MYRGLCESVYMCMGVCVCARACWHMCVLILKEARRGHGIDSLEPELEAVASCLVGPLVRSSTAAPSLQPTAVFLETESLS